MTGSSLRYASSLMLLVVALLATSQAHAGGYDTPILYSARHMGVAGSAVSYVQDPSALFHNPAGLGRIGKASVIANASPLVGSIKAAPSNGVAVTESEPTFAPFFLVGGAYRFTKWLSAGLAVYPVASAGGEYKLGAARDKTQLLFVEASPGLGFSLPGNVELGVGYRITYVNLERFKGTEANPVIDFEMSGINALGFRLGAQWHEEFGDHRIQVGAHYRHKTTTKVENSKGRAIADFRDISTEFVLPTRFVFGPRYDYRDFGVMLDAEYALNSQNKGAPIEGTVIADGSKASVGNVFRWTDAWTIRSGVEYRLVDDKVPVRLGYAWDQKTSNEKWPSAFGTPPGASHIITAGTGYRMNDWQVNAAYAYRTAKGTVTAADIAAGQAQDTCAFCGGAGDYELTMHGIYLDFSYDWK